MIVEQRVQVRISGAARPYSYAWEFDPMAGGTPLRIGDVVELPPNQVSEEGSSGEVVALSTGYSGPLKSIVRKIEPRSNRDDDLWAGFGEGDYR